jgi:hydroxyacylglutathione hydrolase
MMRRDLCSIGPRWVASLAAAATSVACASGPDTHISGPELAALIDQGAAPPIVDVRTQGEYESGHVPGAIHLPFLSSFTRADEIEAPHDLPIVVYCAHGPRAGIAKLGLSSAGFERILYLKGHMTAWKEAGLPMEAEQP